MIFVTIGTQEPFDRLVKTADEIAAELTGITEVVAQVSHTNYQARHMKTFDFISPEQFEKYFSEAELIISHAGMGTIISALVKEKPIIILPRLVKYHEHRSDHQVATANVFKQLDYVHVAEDENELKKNVLAIVRKQSVGCKHKIGEYASAELINSLRGKIFV
ncbi:MAG: glycosyltransferase [Agriterribacter sp.]